MFVSGQKVHELEKTVREKNIRFPVLAIQVRRHGFRPDKFKVIMKIN